MRTLLRKAPGVMGIALLWGAAWGSFFAAATLVVGFLRPQDVGAGEGPAVAARIGLLVGTVSGTIFGVVLAIAEHGKAAGALRLVRVVGWAAAASAVWPLVTVVHDSMIIILCPLGAVCGAALIVVARREASRARAGVLSMGRLVAASVRAACAAPS